jgi:hypothetical protein
MGRMVETAPEIRTEGDVTILPVVEKRLILKEELHIRRRVRQLTQAPC